MANLVTPLQEVRAGAAVANGLLRGKSVCASFPTLRGIIWRKHGQIYTQACSLASVKLISLITSPWHQQDCKPLQSTASPHDTCSSQTRT